MKNPVTNAIALMVGAVFLAVGLSACDMDKMSEPWKDAKRSGTDESPAKVITMPDGFSNLSTKCVDGIRYTVVYHADSTYGAVSTVVDPNCP